ncbi:MAG: pyridoxal phosphate-dependent aminotransferase [Anaerolineales bacterium]
MQFARRTDELKSEGAYHVLAKAQQLEAQGHTIVHFEIGQPDIETYENVRQAGIRAIESGQTRYTAPAGMPALRAAIAEDAGTRRGISFLPQQVIVSPGAKPNLFFPTLALVEPGDEVLYPDPGFPTYRAMILVAGGKPVPYPLIEEDDFAPDLEYLRRAMSERSRLIILNSPSNPTGGVLSSTALEAIAELALAHNCWVMSDEIYSRLHYLEQAPASIVTLPGMAERTIVVDGFSKTYAMTGWRLGYGIMPVELAQKVDLLVTHSTGSTAQFTQYAGQEALRGPQEQIEEMLIQYRQRRDRMVAGLNSLRGVQCQMPQGAFYAFPNIKAAGISAERLTTMILEQAGVALLPGTAFGSQGEGFLRLSYAASMEQIEQGLERLTAFFSALNFE